MHVAHRIALGGVHDASERRIERALGPDTQQAVAQPCHAKVAGGRSALPREGSRRSLGPATQRSRLVLSPGTRRQQARARKGSRPVLGWILGKAAGGCSARAREGSRQVLGSGPTPSPNCAIESQH